MRIAFVHSFYSSRQPSGENFVVESEVNALRKAGYEVELFAAHTDELEGDRLYPIRAALRVATGRGANPLEAIRRFSPDIVHIHNLFPNFGRRWVEDLDVPLVHTAHNYRPLCANGLLLRDGGICTDCPDGKRWSGVWHGCYRNSRLATLPNAWANRKGPMADPLFRRADRVIVLSERQRRVFTDAGVPEEKLVISPNFLPEELDPGPPEATDRDGWLFVGRLSKEKGILRLLDRWPSDEPLRIVGDGPLRAEVETRAARHPRAKVLGSLARHDVLQLMGKSRGLVFPSLWFEAFPLVYLEALACGLPVVAFEPTTVADLVRRDQSGITVTWADDLAEILGPAPVGACTQQARRPELFEQRYSEKAYRARMGGLYRARAASGTDAAPLSRTGPV